MCADLTPIYTTGYPRSGSTWLNRLLSDALSSPLRMFLGEEPEYWGGQGGKYEIVKTHWSVQERQQEGLRVMIQRDPRDVAVSAMFYNQSTDLLRYLKQMVWRNAEGQGIYHLSGWYESFVRDWLKNPDLITSYTRYEWLHAYGAKELNKIIGSLTGATLPLSVAEAVFERQSFQKVRWSNLSKYSHSMRRGIVGDWQNFFRRAHGEFITEHLGQLMLDLEYITDLNWWKELPE